MKKQIVIIGAGPVGLFTSVQLSIRLQKAGIEGYEIVHVEKYTEYKRQHNLLLESESLDGVPDEPELNEVMKKFSDRPNIPNALIESELAALAEKKGIKVVKPYIFETPEKLLSDYPQAEIIIGADGAKSTVRKTVFEGRVNERTLQHVAIVKYKITEGHGLDTAAQYVLCKQTASHFVLEHVQRRKADSPNEPLQVTLQFMIDKETYDRLESKTKFKEQYSLDKLVTDDKRLHEDITRWINARRNHETKTDAPVLLSAIQLNVYKADDVVRFSNGKLWCLVGDAAMGIPFFRAINNGLLCGTSLAKNLSAYIIKRDLPSALKAEGAQNANELAYQLGRIKNETTQATKQKICALLMDWFKNHHMMHGKHELIIPHWNNIAIPHVIEITSVLYYKMRVIYFDPTSNEIKADEVDSFLSGSLNKYSNDAAKSFTFTNEALNDKYRNIEEVYSKLSEQIYKLAGPMKDYKNYMGTRATIEDWRATSKDDGISSVQSVVWFNASLPWEFLSLDEDNGEAVSRIRLNHQKITKFSTKSQKEDQRTTYYAVGLPIFTNEFIIKGFVQKERSLDASTILSETFPYQKITHVFATYREAERYVKFRQYDITRRDTSIILQSGSPILTFETDEPLNLPLLSGTPDIFVGKNHDDDCTWSYHSKTENGPVAFDLPQALDSDSSLSSCLRRTTESEPTFSWIRANIAIDLVTFIKADFPTCQRTVNFQQPGQKCSIM